MKKKLICLCLSIFFLTGCTAVDTITYDGEKITETLVFDNFDLEKYGSSTASIDDILKREYYATITKDKKAETNYTLRNNGMYTFSLKADYTLDQFKNANNLNNCFETPLYVNNENFFVVKLSDGLICKSFDSLKLILETKYEVIKHNADEQDDDKYIWNVTDESIKEKGIYFQVSKKNLKEEAEKNKKSIKTTDIFRIITIIMIVVVALIIYLFMKNQKEFKTSHKKKY